MAVVSIINWDTNEEEELHYNINEVSVPRVGDLVNMKNIRGEVKIIVWCDHTIEVYVTPFELEFIYKRQLHGSKQ